jgi:hypothetical protein
MASGHDSVEMLIRLHKFLDGSRKFMDFSPNLGKGFKRESVARESSSSQWTPLPLRCSQIYRKE